MNKRLGIFNSDLEGVRTGISSTGFGLRKTVVQRRPQILRMIVAGLQATLAADFPLVDGTTTTFIAATPAQTDAKAARIARIHRELYLLTNKL